MIDRRFFRSIAGEDLRADGASVMRTEDILNYQVTAISAKICVDCLIASIDAAKSFWLACLNPHSVRIAMKDPSTMVALKAADILIPDGIGIVLASRILGGGIHERITGSDIFQQLSRRLHDRGGSSYFFLGSTEETLAAIEAKLSKEYPRIRVAGSYSPSFSEVFSAEENRVMIGAVNRAAPDVLWVGMTAPKQEKWIHQNRDKLNVKFIAAVGAVFDFYAGNVMRAHPWFLAHGLEWLPRLLQEPQRLWRRSFVSAPVFLGHVLLQRLRKTGFPTIRE